MNPQQTHDALPRSRYPLDPVALENFSVKFMKQACFVPLTLAGERLEIAIADPLAVDTLETLEASYGLTVIPHQGRREDILEVIEQLYGTGRQSMETIIEQAGRDIFEVLGEDDANADHLRDMASEAPIIRLVNRLILNAIELRASDIHFEPFENEFKVRYRIDGILNDVESPPQRLQSAIISRVKIMAKLDIAERRLPQDGRTKLKISGREIDFRVSTIPTLFGESVVMRILDRDTLVLDLRQLGFGDALLDRYLKLVAQPHGMILVTGPTGSGKTSTLYATLARINSSENKIITLEDPVEYQLKGISQIQIAPKIGLTFAGGLRSIVRQDPDIILVGEIRDRETAETAVQSALTGHLLFSTLHTNDAAGAVTRMLDMGVEGFLLSSTLLGILAQRLVRLLCPECKMPQDPDPAELEAMDVSADDAHGLRLYQPQGCEACRGTGFRGRTAIFEYLKVDEDIRRAITAHADTERIKQVAVEKGMVPLRQDGWRKAAQGQTTLAEVLKVTLED